MTIIRRLQRTIKTAASNIAVIGIVNYKVQKLTLSRTCEKLSEIVTWWFFPYIFLNKVAQLCR